MHKVRKRWEQQRHLSDYLSTVIRILSYCRPIPRLFSLSYISQSYPIGPINSLFTNSSETNNGGSEPYYLPSRLPKGAHLEDAALFSWINAVGLDPLLFPITRSRKSVASPFQNPQGMLVVGESGSVQSNASYASDSPYEASIAEILSNPITLEVFKDHMVNEHNQENIMFYLDVQYYQQIKRRNILKKIAGVSCFCW